jgi:hypothetical protein
MRDCFSREAVRKAVLFCKKEPKNPIYRPNRGEHRLASVRGANSQKFFASFFQKRRP